jgi:asparagine synthetase B (glutamine-hydrolysing)
LTGKWVLREAFRDRLPEVILSRPKMSFPVPFEAELAAASDRHRDWIETTPTLDALVDRQALAGFWQETEQPGQFFRRWPLINLLRWADRWNITA